MCTKTRNEPQPDTSYIFRSKMRWQTLTTFYGRDFLVQAKKKRQIGEGLSQISEIKEICLDQPEEKIKRKQENIIQMENIDKKLKGTIDIEDKKRTQ